MLSSWTATVPRRQPVQPKYLLVRIDPDGVLRVRAHQRTEARHEGAVDIVGQQDQIRPFLEHGSDLLDRLRRHRNRIRIARVDDEERLYLRVEELLQLFIGVLETLLLLRVDLDEMEVVIFQVRHLEIRGEDRHAEGDRVPLIEDPVGLERLEDVAHCRGAAFHGVDLERAFRPRVSAHRPLQIFMDDLFVVHQHAIGHRIVVPDDGIHQLVDELVGVEAELLHRPRHHRLKDGRTGHVLVLLQPRFETPGHARRFRHSADAGRQVEHAFAFDDGELPEQEERFARLGGDPVRIAASRVQVRDGGVLRGLACHLGQEVLDLERAQLLVLFQIQVIDCH